MDAIGDEGETDESENTGDTSYGAGVAKRPKMETRLANISHKNGEFERETNKMMKDRRNF